MTDGDRVAVATYVLDPKGTGDLIEQAQNATPVSATVDHSNMDMTGAN